MSKASFELIEVGGFIAAIEGMRYPTKSVGDSCGKFFGPQSFMLGKKDAALAASLIAKGPVHSKFRRGIKAWFRINMPCAIWPELDTYVVGVDMISSESTMYTLRKEVVEITDDMFVDGTPEIIIDHFRQFVENQIKIYGTSKDIPIEVLKYALPAGWMQKRNRGFSYECLASMYRDRKDHRMPEWRDVICKSIEQLPYFNELILGKTLE
jgi:hypothetical protein